MYPSSSWENRYTVFPASSAVGCGEIAKKSSSDRCHSQAWPTIARCVLLDSLSFYQLATLEATGQRCHSLHWPMSLGECMKRASLLTCSPAPTHHVSQK